MKPEGVVEVVPRNVAQFHAAKWTGEANDPAIQWLADQFGWGIRYTPSVVVITGRHKKQYKVSEGMWVVALGTNGSLRVINEKTYQRDYQEVRA